MYPLTLIRLNINKNVNLELKNRCLVSGVLKKCDIAMNMCLTNVKLITPEKTEVFINECYLKGSSVKIFQLETWILSKQHIFDNKY